MSEFKFTDNSGKTKAELRAAADRTLESALLLLEAQIKANAHVGTGDLRDSIDHSTTRTGDVIWGKVGSTLTYAIYVEFGTGEFAENGAGRKGGWVYKDPSGKFYFTYGMEPQKFMRKAYRTKKEQIKRLIASGLGETQKGGK